MRIAQIINNKAHWIFEVTEMPVFPPDQDGNPIVLLDITEHPDVQEGWDYNPETKEFTEPEPPEYIEPEPMTEIALPVTLEDIYNNQIAFELENDFRFTMLELALGLEI